MGLFKRKDSDVYWMSFSCDGRQYRLSTRTEDEKIAKKIYGIVKAKVALGQWVPEEREQRREYTFRELADKYLDWCKGRQRSEAWKGYIIKQLLEKFGSMELSEFNTYKLEQFQSERLKGGNKPATVNRLLAVFAHMFTKAVDWSMMNKETVANIKIKMLPENNKRLRYLSKEEIQKLITSCDPHLKPIVITALNTGMRKSEILNLKWEQADLRHGFILLDITKNGERREIPINETLRGILQGITRRLDIPYVFYNPITGKPYTKDLKRSFQTALKKAGIKDFKFHDLRHTFASHLVMAGVDLTTVKELLGHKDIKMTLRYAHLAPSHKVKAVDILDCTLTGNYHDFITVNRRQTVVSL